MRLPPGRSTVAGLPVAIGYNVARSKTPEDPRNITDDVFRSIRTSDVLRYYLLWRN